jgi:hypothetical protein
MKSKKKFLAIAGIIMVLTLAFVSCSTSKKSAVRCPEFTKYKSDFTGYDHKKYKKLSFSRHNEIQIKNQKIASSKKNQRKTPTAFKNSPAPSKVHLTKNSFHFNKSDFSAGLLASVDNSIPQVKLSLHEKSVEADPTRQMDLTVDLKVICDTIILRSGVALIGKVEEIKQKEITYRKCNNLTGPLITIQKSDVIRIGYSNGTQDVLTTEVIDYHDVYAQEKDVFMQDNHPVVKTEGLGVAGFVSGIVGLFVAGVILGTAAIIFGSISLRNINRNPGRYKGKGLAIASIIIGFIAVIGALIVISAM